MECGGVLHLLHPSSLAILLNLGEWECRLPGPFPLFQLVLSLLSVLLYVSTLVLWPLYQFYERLGGKPQRSSDEDCIDGFTAYLCTWDQRLVVAVLTASNLLVYVAGLVYWARQLSVGTKGLHSTPDSLRSWEVSSPSSDIL